MASNEPGGYDSGERGRESSQGIKAQEYALIRAMEHVGYTQCTSTTLEDRQERGVDGNLSSGPAKARDKVKSVPVTRTSRAGLVEMQNARRVRNRRVWTRPSLGLLLRKVGVRHRY